MFLLGSVRLWCHAAFAAGICFSILAIVSGAYFLNFRLHSLVTTGTITLVEMKPDSDKNLYCQHFRFETADKHTYTGTCRIWEKAAAPSFSVGEVVSIRYRKSNPSDAWLDAQVHNYPRESAEGGVFSFTVGFAFLWYARRRGISLKFIW
jgi:hypothetical protein